MVIPVAATLAEQGFDGRAALKAVLDSSAYGGAAQAVAALTLFTHPDTVAQIPGGGALFPAVRRPRQRRTLGVMAGRAVGFDDNEAAQDAFAWCNPGRGPWRDVQLNHIYARPADPDAFTAPANLCAGPSFLAKLTDHDPEIAALLKARAYQLYGWRPASEPVPALPEGYEQLRWAPPLPPIINLEDVLRSKMAKRPRRLAVVIARRIGWAFSGFQPDESMPGLPA